MEVTPSGAEAAGAGQGDLSLRQTHRFGDRNDPRC
jgi:hypothetical protein